MKTHMRGENRRETRKQGEKRGARKCENVTNVLVGDLAGFYKDGTRTASAPAASGVGLA